MKYRIVPMLLLAFILLACGAEPPLTLPPPPEALAPFVGGPISECFPSRTALVYEDVNGSGVFDDGERSIPVVSVTMYPIPRNNRAFVGQTGEDGIVTLHGIGDFGPQCDQLEVSIFVPSDYLPTTPTTISLVGVPSSEILYFGLISQFPTPSATAPESDEQSDIFFDACSLTEPEDFSLVFGAPLEYPPISGGGIGEPGIYTYDCMTHQLETSGLMYLSLSVEETAGEASAYFQERVNALPDGALPVNGLGESAYYSSWDDVNQRVIVLQGNTFLELQLSFWLEESPDNQQRLYDLARLILSRYAERNQ